jgi:hypothetical protein
MTKGKATMTKAVIFNSIATKLLSAHMAGLHLRVFDPGKAGWKLTEDGKAIQLKDGNPIWINADGSEGTLNSDAITRINGEAKQHRERAEKAEATLATFEGIDPAKARASLEITDKLDKKKLIDAGEVDRVTNDIKAQFSGQIETLSKENGTLKSSLNDLRIDNVFSQSEFVRENIAMPLDMFQAYFRNNLKVADDGRVEAFDKSGNRIFSKKNTGQVADAAEALEILVDQHPQKAVILKANNNSGGGGGGNGGNRGGGRTVARAEYDKMPGHEQARIAGEMAKGVVTIVD